MRFLRKDVQGRSAITTTKKLCLICFTTKKAPKANTQHPILATPLLVNDQLRATFSWAVQREGVTEILYKFKYAIHLPS